MEQIKWELIVDNRFKYTGTDPQWHKVSIEPATSFSLEGQFKSQNCVLAARYKVYLPYILNYHVRSDDVWIMTYPRSGTTWTQEMIWLINNDYDFPKAQNTSLIQRCPTLRDLIRDKIEVNQTVDDLMLKFSTAKDFQPPHHIKNHLPAAFLPYKIWTVKPKMVYVARNPKDTAISLYHYYKLIYKYEGTMDDFLNLFLNGSTEFGSQTNHILDFWNLRNEENVLFLTFEEMKKDLRKVIRNVAAFMGKTITSLQLEELNQYLQLNSMRERAGNMFDLADRSATSEDVSRQFFRRGKCGSYKDEMNQEIIERFDQLIERDLTANGCDIYA